MWRDWTIWARAGIWAGAIILFYVVMSGVAALVDRPARGFAEFVGSFGVAPLYATIAVLLLGLFGFARWASRREERQQIAQTGVLHVEAPHDTRRTLKRILLVTSPLWAAVAVLFVIAVFVTVTGR